MMADFEGRVSGVAGDALLYLGPASTLTNRQNLAIITSIPVFGGRSSGDL